MALYLKVGNTSDMRPAPRGMASCGSFDWSEEEFEEVQNAALNHLDTDEERSSTDSMLVLLILFEVCCIYPNAFTILVIKSKNDKDMKVVVPRLIL